MDLSLARRHTLTLWNLPLLRGGRSTSTRLTWKNNTASYASMQFVPAESSSSSWGKGSGSQLSTRTRSLVRSILREASYLPDPNARQFVKARTLHNSRKRAFRSWERCNNPDVATLAKNDHLHDARKDLSRLRRANEGERSALLWLLLFTYGRIGSRRYELLRPLYQTDANSSTRDVKEFLRVHQSTRDADFDPLDGPEVEEASMGTAEATTDEPTSPDRTLDQSSDDDLPVLTPEIYALAKSQKQANPPTHTRKNPRHLKPSIPATNARMLPMPRKRVKNMHRNWYADLLNRILPPLPTKEWEQLRDWSKGKNLPHMNMRRRSNPTLAEPAGHFGRFSALEAIIIQGRIDKAVYGNREAHEITPRFMQRLWATVFSNCPYMIFDDETNEWNVLWGHHELAAPMLSEVQKIMDEGTLPTT